MVRFSVLNSAFAVAIGALLSGCSGGGAGIDDPSDDEGSIGATGVPLYVLAGGTSAPDITDLYLDSANLEKGELFIVPKDPLLASSVYSVNVTVIAGGVTFTSTPWSFTTAAGATAPATGTVLDEINTFRAQAGVPILTVDADLTEAAVGHSGYQSEKDTLTEGEADATAAFFVANTVEARIVAARGAALAANVFAEEVVATNSGPQAVDGLWNTVYNRLPMMRVQTLVMGRGERSDAFTDPRNTPQVFPAVAANQYETIDFLANSSIAQTASFWPANGQIGVPTSFDSDAETPDPIDNGNANGTPDDGLVGVPIHIVFPTSANFTSVTVTVTKI